LERGGGDRECEFYDGGGGQCQYGVRGVGYAVDYGIVLDEQCRGAGVPGRDSGVGGVSAGAVGVVGGV